MMQDEANGLAGQPAYANLWSHLLSLPPDRTRSGRWTCTTLPMVQTPWRSFEIAPRPHHARHFNAVGGRDRGRWALDLGSTDRGRDGRTAVLGGALRVGSRARSYGGTPRGDVAGVGCDPRVGRDVR